MLPSRPLVALVLLAVPLAGCAGLPFGTTEEATAADLFPAAEGAARAWREDAYLLAASTVEAVNRSDYAEFPRVGELFLDPAPGNGRAPFWVYLFHSPRDGAVGVFTVPARTRAAVEVETHEPTKPTGHGSAAPVTTGPPMLDLATLIDSDDAMQRARGDPRFADALAGLAKPSFLFHVETEAREGESPGPRWSLFAIGSEGGAAHARVHASSGTVERAGPANESEVPGVGYKPRHTVLHAGRHDGTLTIASPRASYPIVVTEAGAGLRVQLCGGTTIPAGSVTATVYGPGGEKLATSQPAGPGGDRTLEIPSLAKGDHRLEIALADPSAASDFVVASTLTSGGVPPESPPFRC